MVKSQAALSSLYGLTCELEALVLEAAAFAKIQQRSEPRPGELGVGASFQHRLVNFRAGAPSPASELWLSSEYV